MTMPIATLMELADDPNDPDLLMDVEGIHVRVLRAAQREKVVAAVAFLWPAHNPLTMALGITRDDYYPLAAKRVRRAVKSGHSIVAIDTNNNDRLVAFIICGDYLQKEEEKWLDESRTKKPISPKFQPHFAFSETVFKGYEEFHEKYFGFKCEPGQIMLMDLGGVEPMYMGSGISYYVMECLIRHSEREKFIGVLTNNTTYPSQVMMQKRGYMEVHKRYYGEFVFEGKRPFARLKRPPYAILNLMDLRKDKVKRAELRAKAEKEGTNLKELKAKL